MRLSLLAFVLLLFFRSTAQDLPSDLDKMPAWMVTLLTEKEPTKPYKPNGKPLHTNTFSGTWEIKTGSGETFNFWSDPNRIVIQQPAGTWSPQRAILIDLQTNVKLNVTWHVGEPRVEIEDLHIPGGSYFYELFNDTVIPTGKTEKIMGVTCKSFIGTNSNRDSTWYWKTDVHPALFADMKVWASWLCRDGELEYLSALSDKNAGSSLKVTWRGRQYSSHASGSMTFTSITPGKVPMPAIDLFPSRIAERRRLWTNNTRIGRLPDWMRASINPLPPHPLPIAYTPPVIDRNIPDNKFIGTFTAETKTMVIDGNKDTTERVATYSYWADARRAVLRLDDPDDKGHMAYMVDLDADVIAYARDEMNSALPRLYITTLEDGGLDEFGNGLELDFQPQGRFQTINGRKCELYIAPDRMLRFFWIPEESVINPIFDIKNWIEKRAAHVFQDVIFFGVAGKPMPMDVMGTYITSYKPGKTKPPVLDLTNHGIRDERLKDRRDEERRERIHEIRPIDITNMDAMDVAVPEPENIAVEEMPMDMKGMEDPVPPPVMEGRWEGISPAPAVEPKPVPAPTPVKEVENNYPLPDVPPIPSLLIPAELLKYLDHPTNRFMGSVYFQFSQKQGDKSKAWKVRYHATADVSILISQGYEPLPNPRTRAWVIDRKAGTEKTYTLHADSTVTMTERPLNSTYTAITHSFLLDKPENTRMDLLQQVCTSRKHESERYWRQAWMAKDFPSIYLDLFSARKTWEGIDETIHGNLLAVPDRAMPLKETLDTTGESINMQVISIFEGFFDNSIFHITKETFKR